ncbi:tetratricopeptide repeat protein [Sesbania bispinosa]|nr:tetratricopeptide repeat protein [Sesbania bispinosa]
MSVPQQCTKGLTMVTARNNGWAEREAAMDGDAAARAARVATLRRWTPRNEATGRGTTTLCGCRGVWLRLAARCAAARGGRGGIDGDRFGRN